MFGHNTFTGIDLGSWSIKAVTISGRRGSYTLKNAAYMKLAQEDRHGSVSAQTLASFLRSKGIRPGKAAVLMTGHSLMFRHFSLPPMPEKDLKEAVKWEIRKEVSIAPADIVADFVTAAEAKGGPDQKSSIIAFAGVRKDIDSIIGLYGEAGVEARVIEVVPTALLASFDASNLWENDANYAILDMGLQKSTLAIFKRKRLAFTREISIGGDDFTRALQRTSGKTSHEAEDMKGSAHAGDSSFQTATERLASELQRSFDYYQAQFREGGVDKLFLSGGTALLRGLDSMISGTIGVHTFIDDPFRKIRLPHGAEGLTGLGPCFSVATGLAMRAEGA